VIVQGAFNLLFRPGLREDFRDTYDQWETEYTMYLRTSSTGDAESRATIMTGLNRLYERGDGEAIIYDDPKLGPQVVGVDKEFAGGFQLTRKTVEDDKYNKANQAAKWLAHAARLTAEYRSAAFLDDAETGTFFKGIDGLALCHTAHTLINGNGVTVANRPASDIQLSVAGLNALMDLWTVMKDENGDPMRAWPDQLLIGTNPGDINTATAIFNSNLEPFTADNTDNVTKRRLSGINPEVSHYKSDRKSYFLNSKKLNDAHFVTRRAVEFDDFFDFDTDVAKYKSTTRFMIWFVDWRGWSGAFPS
jgi:hypothetical protein